MASLNFKALADATPVVAVIVSILALLYQIRRSRIATSLELVTKFDDRFNGDEFRKVRLAASQALSEHPSPTEAEDVFDFFETLGYLARTGAAEKGFLWHTFYHWVHGYWSAGSQHIKQKRTEAKNAKLWCDFEALHAALLKIERREANQSEPEFLSPDEIKHFLNEELGA